MTRRRRIAIADRPRVTGVLLAVAVLALGCSPQRLVVRLAGKALAEGGDVFTSDDDPELVRDALPFALKTTEALLASAPDDRRLRAAAAKGFVGYAWAFPETDALLVEAADPDGAAAARQRARRLYLRGRDHALAGIEVTHPGLRQRLERAPAAAAAELGAADVELAYWAAAGWGGALGIEKDPVLLADLPAIRALFERVLALDDGFADGGAHEAMITLAALRQMGGSPEQARRHFERALARGGERPGPYLSLALAVAVPEQDRSLFGQLLAQALAVDPDRRPSQRLVTLIGQRRARYLQGQADVLFLEPLVEPTDDAASADPVTGAVSPQEPR